MKLQCPDAILHNLVLFTWKQLQYWHESNKSVTGVLNESAVPYAIFIYNCLFIRNCNCDGCGNGYFKIQVIDYISSYDYF